MNKNFVYVKRKILFSLFLITLLLISTNEANVATASPETTYFYVDPSEVTDEPIGDVFQISINVNEAPPSYSWEVQVRWDLNLLELSSIPQEGDFLKRSGAYSTIFMYYPTVDEANSQGEIMIASNLAVGNLPMDEWASGDGELCKLSFRVKAEGSSVINLFDTFLVDHLIAGAPQGKIYCPNDDGLFYNVDIHDIAITNVTRAQSGALVAINVTVANQGNYTETSGTFNVTVYADTEVIKEEFDVVDFSIRNTTVVGDEIVVGTQTVTEDLAVGATTTLTFSWDTNGVAGGIYTISAEAMGDNDTRKNLFTNGTVTVTEHDVAITNVVPSPTEVTVGENVTIEVTVENQGSFNETFDVTVYYDSAEIETKTGIFLENGTSTTLAFKWDTTDVAKDTYDIKAVTSVITDEVATEDNTFILEDAVKVRGEAGPDILLYVAVVIVIIIGAAIAVYFIWFRKPT